MKLLGYGGSKSPINMLSSEWRKPFNFSIGLHIIVVVLAMLAPFLFDQQPKLPEIYTVKLFSASELTEIPPSPAKTPAAKPIKKQVTRKIEPEVKKPAVSIQPSKPEVSAPVKTAITKPISLRPVKQKVKVGKTKDEEALDKAKVSQVVQRIKSKAAEKEAKAEADHAAKDAVSKLADALKTSPPGPTSGPSEKAVTGQTGSATKSASVSGPRGTSGIELDFYEKQYYATIVGIIQDHYILSPHLDMQKWDKNMEVTIGITIRRDGTITKINYEEKSANMAFNRSTKKAIEEANPLPPFPDQIIEDILEIGFKFHPGGLY